MTDDELREQQRELEELALAKGAERFVRSLYGELDETAFEAGITRRSRLDPSRTQPGKRLIVDFVDKITVRLREQFTREKDDIGRSATNLNPFLYAESLEGIAFLAMKSVIDFFFRSVTRGAVSEVPRTKLINTLGSEILLELCAQKARREPSGEFMAIETTIANKKYGKDDGKRKEYLRKRKHSLISRMKKVELEKDAVLPIRIGLVIYHILRTEGMIESEIISDRYRKTTMCRLSSAIVTDLRERFDRWADDHPVWGSTVLPPRPWVASNNGGYRFKLRNALPLIKTRGKHIGKEKCPEVFDAVNHLQSTSYRINKDIL